jgi:predicted DNA-binding transcriptional regulator YafY
MATNKQAIIRYNALDKCFSNRGRRYYIEDLISECNKVLNEISSIGNGIKRRQIYDDIKFMESEQGWSAPLERCKDGKRIYYRYSEPNYSIKTHPVNQKEIEQLHESLSVLCRFKGMPQFNWIDEILVRLKDTFKIDNDSQPFVSFEQNPYLKGLNHFTNIFDAIQNKQVLEVQYQSFKTGQETIEIHPWHLKQYNNRWFLFGFNGKYEKLTNLAIDRIVKLKQVKKEYVINTNIDFEDYFYDTVGVTVKDNENPQKVILRVSKEIFPYIESKPIHGSQKIRKTKDGDIMVELLVQINYELTSQLFAFMDGIEIIEPTNYRKQFEDILRRTLEKYL